MASPLILKIQAELERRGFDDVKRQIDRLKDSISNLGDEFQETEQKSGGFLKGVIVTTVAVTGALIIAGIQQERVAAQLANSLAGVVLDAESTADSIQDLTNSMVRNSLFGAGELRDSLTILTRSSRSLTLAQEDSLIAQELALRNNISLEQASKALALAHAGEGRALAALTELGVNEIETLRERGELREELARAIPIGEATGRELNTISGAIEQFSIRSAAAFSELGEVVLEQFQTPIQASIGFIEGLGDAVTFALDNTFLRQRRAAEATALLGAEFEQVDRALKLIGQSGAKSFGDLEQAISDIDVALQSLNKVEGELTLEQQAQRQALESTRLQAVELQRTQSLIGRTTLRDQINVFRQLNLSREDFQRQELQNQLRTFEELRDARTLSDTEALVNQQLIVNARLNLARFEKETIIDNIEEEVDARRQLFALLQAPATTIDETTSIEERGRALDRLVQSRKDNLLLIASEERAALATLRLQADTENLTEREIENRRRIIEATALARRLEVERETEARAAEIGDVEGRPDVRARSEARLDELLRKQAVSRNTQTRDLREQVQESRQLERLERDITTLRAKGADITTDESNALARISVVAQRLRENQDTAIPTSEEAIENLVTEIERKLDIPPININFNQSIPEIQAAVRESAINVLEERGLDVSRETSAATEPDEVPA